MDRLKLLRIDEGLVSSEVAALCFLCSEVVNKKHLEGIKDARQLFSRLEEKGVLENSFFLSQLLQTIRRTDLLSYLETDSKPPEETDASPTLSAYRVMLYNIYDDMTQENLDKMKFLLSTKLYRRQTEASDTALALFIKMENIGILSNTNIHELLGVLQETDHQLASTVQQYIDQINQQDQTRVQPHVSMDYQRVNNKSLRPQLSIPESQPSYDGGSIRSDAEPNEEPSSPSDEAEYYPLTHTLRGLCLVFNNENFAGPKLRTRTGTQEDEKALCSVFDHRGFTLVTLNDFTASAMREKLNEQGKKNFPHHDALVPGKTSKQVKQLR